MKTNDFKEIQELVFIEYVKNGFRDVWEDLEARGAWVAGNIAELALIGTEVSEAIEDVRKKGITNDLDHLAEELADIIIRVMNYATRKNIDLVGAIHKKHQVNMDRRFMHGKKS